MGRITDRIREQRFVMEYLANGCKDGQAAAIAAGFSPNGARVTASRLLKKPEVKAQIDKAIDKVTKKLENTYSWKITKLKDCIECALTYDESGKPQLVNHKALIGAISELNRMEGHYAAEKMISLNTSVDTDLQTLTELIQKHERPY